MFFVAQKDPPSQDEVTWQRRKSSAAASSRKRAPFSPTHAGKGKGKDYQHLRGAVVASMLRFRNMTGSAFDSAANHRLVLSNPHTPHSCCCAHCPHAPFV